MTSKQAVTKALRVKLPVKWGAIACKVMALDEYNTDTLSSEKLLLIVTSTFGNGEMPGNGKKFLPLLKKQPAGSLDGLNYSASENWRSQFTKTSALPELQ